MTGAAWLGVALFIIWAGVTSTATPFLHSEGELLWSVSEATSLGNAEWEVGWYGEGWRFGFLTTFAENTWETLGLAGNLTFAKAEIMSHVVFDPTESSFSFTEIQATATWGDYRAEGLALLESEGLGWRVFIRGGRGTFLERLRLWWNLKYGRDELEEETFSPFLTWGDLVLRLSDFVSLFSRFNHEEGFEHAGLQFGPTEATFWDIRWFATMIFSVDRATVYHTPSLWVKNPPGTSFYLGTIWDRDTSELSGIKLYGFSFYGKIGDVRFRSYTSLEGAVSLIKEPYWELVGLIWEWPSFSGEEKGEASVAFLFGGESLFSLGEVDFESEIPLFEGFTLSIGAYLETAGGDDSSVSFGWTYAL